MIKKLPRMPYIAIFRCADIGPDVLNAKSVKTKCSKRGGLDKNQKLFRTPRCYDLGARRAARTMVSVTTGLWVQKTVTAAQAQIGSERRQQVLIAYYFES